MNPTLSETRSKFLVQQSKFLPASLTNHTINKTKLTSIKIPERPEFVPKAKVKSVGGFVGGKSHRFASLCKIVNFLQRKHLEGNTTGFTLNEIFEELGQPATFQRLKVWLKDDALKNNPRIQIKSRPHTIDDVYAYDPPVKAGNRKALLRLLKHHHSRGLGGILVEDIHRSLMHAERTLQILDSETVKVTRSDKRQVAFYNEEESSQPYDDDLRQLWRSVSLRGVDNITIEQHLENRGIAHLKKTYRVAPHNGRNRAGQKRRRNLLTGQAVYKHNQHMTDVLKDYDENGKATTNGTL